MSIIFCLWEETLTNNAIQIVILEVIKGTIVQVMMIQKVFLKIIKCAMNHMMGIILIMMKEKAIFL